MYKNNEKEKYSSSVSNKLKTALEEFLDKTLVDFFPKDGHWKSNCFRKPQFVAEENLPCHLRDNNWLADLILKKYNLYSLGKGTIIEYINNSENFNKMRYEYEQKIVSWQIDWMRNGGDNWIVDAKLGSDLYIFSPKCDYAFRKGVVDTLLAIGIDIDAIEEGIEKNANKWREAYMRIAFYNLYSVSRFIIHGNENKRLEEPSEEHYEKWMKLRLYEYYVEHKDSVDKYGKILPEMQMTDLEVTELKKWLDESHKKRMQQITEYNMTPIMREIDYYGCDITSSKELAKLMRSEEKNVEGDNNSVSFMKRLFRNKLK